MDAGNDQQHQGRKHYHRHTPSQIQALEASFQQCTHPDEMQRAKLSRDIGLEPRKIKYWFQNRRTQMKVQHERKDNDFLRAENHKIRCENVALREAIENAVCPSCGPSVAEDYYDEQRLRMENARLKEELSGLTSKHLGRPLTQMPQGTPQLSVSPLDLSMGGVQMGGHHQPFCGAGLSLDCPKDADSRTGEHILAQTDNKTNTQLSNMRQGISLFRDVQTCSWAP